MFNNLSPEATNLYNNVLAKYEYRPAIITGAYDEHIKELMSAGLMRRATKLESKKVLLRDNWAVFVLLSPQAIIQKKLSVK